MRHRKVLLVTTLIAVLAVVIGVANIGGAGAEPDGIGRWGRSDGASSSAAARSAEPSAAEVQAAAARSLTFIEEETQNFAFVDVGPRGESVGDYFIFRDRLLNPRTNAHVGSMSVRCTLAFFSTECNGTAIVFDRGKITLAGNVPNTGDRFAVAITGGTAEFRAARGQVFVTETANRRDPIVFQLV
jgi:hypothetical protein